MGRKAKGTLNHNALEKCFFGNVTSRMNPTKRSPRVKSLLISSGFSIYLVAPVFAATADREKLAGYQSIFTVQLAKKRPMLPMVVVHRERPAFIGIQISNDRNRCFNMI